MTKFKPINEQQRSWDPNWDLKDFKTGSKIYGSKNLDPLIGKIKFEGKPTNVIIDRRGIIFVDEGPEVRMKIDTQEQAVKIAGKLIKKSNVSEENLTKMLPGSEIL